jgi:predicted nucleotidyltransferase component of viral defense system
VTKAPKDVDASVRARLLQLAKKQGEDFQLVLTRYANERLLYRLAQSSHATSFVLKGAALFMLWTDKPHRATRDVDLLGFGDPSSDRIRAVMTDLICLDVEDDDGLTFDQSTLEVEPIREDQDYGGIRAVVIAVLAGARARLQVDVGFGDVVTPGVVDVVFPTLLDLPAPRLRAYTRETVVAEKLEAIVQLGLANSRMKDFYDLIILSRMFEFQGPMLARAILATFSRRKTSLPDELPVGLTATFAADPSKLTQWTAFLRKSGAEETGELAAIVNELVGFVWQPLEAASRDGAFELRWPPRGPWQT